MKRTPKARVLKRWPKAYSWHWADGYCIYNGEFVNETVSDSGQKTPALAWANAARRSLTVGAPTK